MPPGREAPMVAILEEFLEAWVHQVLFLRELYRPELFERQRLYGVAVKKSRHPGLNDYIHGVISGLREPLAHGTLARVALVVLSPEGRAPLERFVVEPRLLGGEGPASVEVLGEVHAALRGCLLKLQYVEPCLRALPPGCSFELAAYCSSGRGLAQEQWAAEAPGPGGGLELAAAAGVVPIKTAAVEPLFRLQLYAES